MTESNNYIIIKTYVLFTELQTPMSDLFLLQATVYLVQILTFHPLKLAPLQTHLNTITLHFTGLC